MVLKVRDTLVCQRTLLVNTLRGHATEFGVIAARGTSAIGGLLKAIEIAIIALDVDKAPIQPPP
jgi:transposase